MITLIMRDKSLTCNTTSTIYQYENNIEQIKCLIPCCYNGVELTNAVVILVYKDEDGNGGFIELQKSDIPYSNDYLQFSNYINSTITQHVGKITIWLKVNDYQKDISFETGETYLNITPSKEMPVASESVQMSFFDQWLIKMEQIQNKTLSIQRDVINVANITRLEIEKIMNELGGRNNGN